MADANQGADPEPTDQGRTTQNGPSADLAGRLMSTRRHPQIHYLAIPKCGCTFVKNLLWRIDHRADHSNPIRIHDDDTLIPRVSDFDFSVAEIRQNPYGFTILRNPMDRFLSLYFDKIIGDGHRNFPPLRDTLAAGYGLDPFATTAQAHRQNCMILLDWLDVNIRGANELPRDGHWTPQTWRMDVIEAFDLKILTLGDAKKKLRNLLRPLVPTIDDVLDSIEQNRSERPVPRGAVVDDALITRLSQVYRADRDLAHMAWQFWEENDPKYPEDYPRISDLRG